MVLADELRSIVRGDVMDDAATKELYSRDASLFRIEPRVVVRVKSADDVKAIVTYVTEKKRAGEEISVTARAAGTDMSGGVLSPSIVLDTTTYFNKFLELGDRFAVAEPGIFFRDFDKKTREKNMEMPGYPASRNLAALGGMVSNNAGGEKNLKLGKTARYVEEVEAVLSDGNVHTLRNLEGEQLQAKLSEQSFEGDLYRAVSHIVKENLDVIETSKPTVTKNSSGYALWDIGDGVKSLNLARLFAGAQGTLGIITKLKMGLVPLKAHSSMVVIMLKDFKDLETIVPTVLSKEPDSFESYDNHTFTIALKYFPELAKQMGAGIITLAFKLIPEFFMVLSGGIPKMVLLAEFRSDSQEECFTKAKDLYDQIKLLPLPLKVRIAKNQKAAQKFWTIRRESFSLLRKKVRGKRTAPFIDDFVVLPKYMPEFLPKLTDIISKYDLQYTIAGHIGDGNLHIVPLIDPKKPDMSRIIDEMAHKVYDLVLSYKGSISGEHNDGYIRTPYLEQMFGTKMVSLFKEVKRAFDPLAIFNPGKKVGITFAEAMEHLDLVK